MLVVILTSSTIKNITSSYVERYKRCKWFFDNYTQKIIHLIQFLDSNRIPFQSPQLLFYIRKYKTYESLS